MRKKINLEPEEEEINPHKKVKPDTNYLNGKPYSPNYFKLLETRRKLPAYDSRFKLV
mgnify:CR=1 FL=1